MGWELIDKYEAKEVEVGVVSDVKQDVAEKRLRALTKEVVAPRFEFKNFAKPVTNYKAIECVLNSDEPYTVDTNWLAMPDENPNQNNIVAMNKANINNVECNNEAVFRWNNITRKLVRTCEGDASNIANFTITINDLITKIAADNTKKSFILIGIKVCGRKLALLVDKEKYCELNKEILKNHPECIVYNPKYFLNYAAEKLVDTINMAYKESYLFSGWYQVNGKLIYLNSAMPNVDSNVILQADISKANEFLINFMRTSSEKNKLVIMLLYSLWAYFAVFYEEARIDGCRSVLYLSAPTGTGKTSLAKILSSALLDKNAKSVMRFDDTVASLEESLFNARDLISLVDDFYAKGNKQEEQDFKAKASTITRIVGDGMIKGKMGADRKPMPDRHYRGGLIATGEYIDLNTHSSYLRCWVLNFPEHSIYFNHNLDVLQKKPELAKAFYSLWIQWLEVNQTNINEQLKELHKKNLELVRARYKKTYARLISNIATFQTIGYFLDRFSNNYHLNIDMDMVYDGINEESAIQLKLLDNMSPQEIVIKALNEALDNAYVKIADSEEQFKTQDYDGYYDEKHLIIITSRFENVIEKYANKNNYGLKFNTALKDALVSKGILSNEKGSCNVKYTKVRSIEPKRPRIYQIIKGAL